MSDLTHLSDDLILTHFGEAYEEYKHAVSPPIFLTSLHTYESCEEYNALDPSRKGQYVYGRCSNPTVSLLEEKIAALEHASRAVAFSSGMAACTAAILATCEAHAHIICIRDTYQPVKRFLDTYAIPKLQMEVTYVLGTELDEIEAAIRPNTKLMILESPASLVFTVLDLQKIAELAHAHGIKTYIDNTHCTPLYQKPLDLGIDIVMHTMSKYIGGHSDIIGGILCSKNEALMLQIMQQMREWLGGILGPMEAWLAIRGLRTLKVRLKQHQETAMACARFLEQSPKVERVYYTGLDSHPQKDLIQKQMSGHNGLFSVLFKGGIENSVRFANALKLFGKACSWGGFESLAIVPFYKSSDEELAFLGMERERGLLRLHCGLEGTESLLEDLESALQQMQ